MSEKRVGDRARPRHPDGNVLRLARRELQRTWPSYLTSGALNLLLGLLALSLVLETAVPGEVGSPETSVAVFPADLLLVVFLANLCTNWASRNYMQTSRDPFHEHLAFLRTLPVSAAETVKARVLVMLLSVAVMAWVFFAPFYALLMVLGPEVQEAPGGVFSSIWSSSGSGAATLSFQRGRYCIRNSGSEAVDASSGRS